MTMTSGASRYSRPSSLADVLELILDKGIVIDAYVRVSLVGIELLTIDARIVIASVDTYLRFAEAVNRLDLQPQGQVTGLPGMVKSMQSGGAGAKTRGALGGLKEKATETIDEIRGDDGGGSDAEPARERRRPRRRDGDEDPERRRKAARRASSRRERDER